MFRSLINYDNPRSLGSRLRRKRFRFLAELIADIQELRGQCKLLDVGGTATYWLQLDPVLRPKTEIVVLNIAEPRGAYPRAHTPEGLDVTHVVGDGRNLSLYADESFDLVHSNSVIEHVGRYEDMQLFANEARRVGRWYFVQTPNVWFPVDPHYGVPIIHWLPWPARARLLTRTAVGFKSKFETYRDAVDYVEFVNLIDRYSLVDLFPEADIVRERFLFLTKSLMAVRAPQRR